MTFGPALSLGVHGLREVVDIKLGVDLDPESVLEDLTRASAQGVRFHRGVRLGPSDPPVTRIIDGAEYVVVFARKAMPALEDEIRAFFAKPEARVLRRVDGIGKWVDVRAYVRSIDVGGEEVAREAGIEGDIVCLRVVVRISQTGGVKISEVCEALDLGETPSVMIRAEMFAERDGARVSLFDPARLRPAPRALEAAQ
jgi:radical SAM-linked protein